jgi:ferrous iron transport protein B
MKTEKKSNTIALAGQPNTGKSTIFNRLTGSNQHVGNWPGKTVEKKEGAFKYNGQSYKLVDLPGTYSLTANSLEEIVARDFIIKEQPDVLIVVVDASQLERTLYLVAETAMLRTETIVALNMMDIAEKEGRVLSPEAMGKEMCVKVIPMVAAKNKGIPELLEAIKDSVDSGKPDKRPEQQVLEGDTLALLKEIKLIIKGCVPSPYSEEWTALKLLEGDEEISGIMRNSLEPVRWREIDKIVNDSDALLVADSRYEWIQKIISTTGGSPDRKNILARRHKFDRIATHPVGGKFVAVGILLISIVAAFIIGVPLATGVFKAVILIIGKTQISLAFTPVWFNSMLTDGILVGVGVATSIFSFLMVVFIVVGLLEDIGYLPRLAYVFDSFMQRLGLHGKSFMPFLMSFTCNIAGVLGTRVVDSWRQRFITIVMIPIIPCLAVWGVIAFIGILFFGAKTPLVVVALLIVMVFHLILTSFLLRRIVVKGERTGLIMDLPPYHKPNLKTIWGYAWTNGKAFLKRGLTLIALISFFVWLLSYFPNGNIETSFLASTGKFLNPIGQLMGFDWRLMVALIIAMVQKEASFAAIAVIYGIGQKVTSVTGAIVTTGIYEREVLGSILMQTISPAAALAFVFALTFSIPCMATIGALYSETKSLKWTAGASVYYTLSSLIAGILAYHAGLLIL